MRFLNFKHFAKDRRIVQKTQNLRYINLETFSVEEFCVMFDYAIRV